MIETLDEIGNEQQLGAWLLEDHGLAMAPGSAFAAPGHMRLSFATDNETLEKALVRLKDDLA